jgi:hypothetical protein
MWGGDENQKPILRKYGKNPSVGSSSFSASDFAAVTSLQSIPSSSSEGNLNTTHLKQGTKVPRKLENISEEVKSKLSRKNPITFEEALRKGHADDKAFLAEVTEKAHDTSTNGNTVIICTFHLRLPSFWSVERAERCSTWLRELDFESQLSASVVSMVHQKKTVRS